MSRWQTALCKSCSEPVVWAKTETGKAMPIDAELVATGTVLLHGPRVRPTATVVSPGQAAAAAAVGTPLYRSHFATCRAADQHRQRIDDRHRRAAQRAMPTAQGDLFGDGGQS